LGLLFGISDINVLLQFMKSPAIRFKLHNVSRKTIFSVFQPN